MARGSARVTAAEVARRSGVSQATVSYVLNDNPAQKISEGTRQRVLRAVAELGYTPYEPARALRSGQSSVVLFVAPDYPVGHVIGEMLDRLIDLLTRQGRTLLTHRVTTGVDVLDVARALSPYAVISMAPLDSATRSALEEVGARVEVLGFRERTGAQDPDVIHPQERVGRMQAAHLHARGHTRIGYALSDDPRAEMFSAPRLEAVRGYCAEHGLPAPTLGTIRYDLDEAIETVRAWHGAGITAICAFTDDTAIGVMGAAHALELVVPDDLAVIGVDDIPLAVLTVPPLTTVHLDVDAMARDTVRLLGLVAGDAPEPDEAERAWIVERSST
ncbi:MAG: LacI family DNA-binding transcriptional regulator [Microbacterium sp.]